MRKRPTLIQIILVVLICLPPLVVALGRPRPQQFMEGLSLLSAQETWQRQLSGETDAWLTPTQNGDLRVRKPPLLVWADMLAWTGLDPRTASIETIMLRARLATAALAVVMILSTYWIGRTLGDRPGVDERGIAEPVPGGDGHAWGLLAALICGTMMLTQQQARMASYDMHLAAWSALAVAAGVAAVGSQASARRRLWLWIASGAATALAYMSKGPISLVVIAAGVVPAISLLRRERSAALGWWISIVVAITLVAPWYVYLYLQKPTAFHTLLDEYEGNLTSAQPAYYYFLKLPKVGLPWTLWMLGGLILPWMASMRRFRSTRLVPWAWFIVLLAFFSAAKGKTTRYILPIAPSMALLAASLWVEHIRIGRERRRDPGVKWFTVPHWTGIMVVSATWGWFLLNQRWIIDRGWMTNPVVTPPSATAAALLTGGLLALAAIGVAMQVLRKPFSAALVTALWMGVVSTAYWRADAVTPQPIDRFEAEADRVRAAVGEAPLYHLRNAYDDQPDYDFLFFLRRVIPPVRPQKLDELARRESPTPIYVMARASAENKRTMRQAGFEKVMEFSDSSRGERELWRSK